MRSLIRSTFARSDIREPLREPLGHMLYGALQEMALAIGEADDPATARSDFGDAAR